MKWNYNIDEAPKGTYIEHVKTNKLGVTTRTKEFVPDKCWIAHNNGKTVCVSSILEDGRWNGMTKDEKPLAFAPLLKHPDKE